MESNRFGRAYYDTQSPIVSVGWYIDFAALPREQLARLATEERLTRR
jgi:hypothetical protein